MISPRNIDLITSMVLMTVGIVFIVAALTLAASSAIWFLREFENVPDIVMERIVELSLAMICWFIGRHCTKVALQIWQRVP